MNKIAIIQELHRRLIAGEIRAEDCVRYTAVIWLYCPDEKK